MNSKEYWEQRAILKDKLLEKDISKVEKELLKLFKNSKKEVLNELKIIYSDIESTEYQKYRIDSLLTSINNSLDNLYSKSEKEITEGLKDIYKTMYQEANVDLKASFNTINENLIEEVTRTNLGTKLNESRDIFVLHNEVLNKIVDDLIASNWSGLTLVERILEHKRKLSLTLKEELSKGLIRGDSLQDMSRILSKKMDLSYSNALRIVRTESCWVMNEATVSNYKDNGVKEYEFMAFLDKKTSPQCRELDGKRLYIDEARAGLNLPPLHPNCRSCIIPITEKVVVKKTKESIKEEKALNKYGQEIQFNLEGSKEEAKNRIIKTITELSNKYNTSLVSVNRNKGGKEAGKVNVGMNMYLSSSRKNDIVHEFAHSLSMTHREKLKLSNDKEFWKEMKKLNKEYKKAINSDRSKMISVYSTESVDEFLAEGFAHSYLREEIKSDWYGKDYEFSDKIMAIVNKYFLKK
ncbi:MAG: minor capsid protein [Peptostreptococcaceae bacterium]|nr:minor capsid protein [Peptostreptococcaceae bacterium]